MEWRRGKSFKRSCERSPKRIDDVCSASEAVAEQEVDVVRRGYGQRSLFEVLLPDGDKLWDPELERVDKLLDDEELVDTIQARLEKRHPRSRRWGRPGTPAEVVLRMLVLKHLYNWSFEECEREVRGSLVYRSFCRIGCERVPDAKTLIRLFGLIDGPTLRALLERLVQMARQRRVIRGHRLRVDTTVVETAIHYPTDSGLLGDGIRVLQRGVKKLGRLVEGVKIRDRSRSVRRKVFEIARLSRRASSQAAQEKRKARYQEVMGLARATVRDTERILRGVMRRKGIEPVRTRVQKLRTVLREQVELVKRVVRQTRARILGGDTHYPDKLLSIFETHTEAIRKGKASKPTEFGKLVKIQEAEAQFITDFEVYPKRVPDQTIWVPSLNKHIELFGRPPRLATADGGFASGANRREAAAKGVKQVVLPGARRSSPTTSQRRAHRKALRWRTGSEGRISALKRRHGLDRCRYHGMQGIKRSVGLAVIANNLLALARADRT